jgi:hypothetical protein
VKTTACPQVKSAVSGKKKCPDFHVAGHYMMERMNQDRKLLNAYARHGSIRDLAATLGLTERRASPFLMSRQLFSMQEWD